jgi:DNA polymerase I-like protein with 3'-5' exonuclease and polymerase domains
MLTERPPEVEALLAYASSTKLLSTYMAPMRAAVDESRPMNCSYNVLAATGRTTSFGGKLKVVNPWWSEEAQKQKPVEIAVGTNAQNWPQKDGIRDCVVPREGFYFASVDYNSLEIRTLAQSCIWLLGRSTLAQGYQTDHNWDPHTYMGAQLDGISYQEAMAKKGTPEWQKFSKGPRALGKALNFSLAGGVGPARFSEMAMLQYKAGFLSAPVSVEDAYKYKQAYLQAYPEMRNYFDLAAFIADSQSAVTQHVSKRVRRGLTFTSAANTRFQGLAADLAKRALFRVSRECYCDPTSDLFGSRVAAFIHDEILLEVPIARSHEAVLRCEKVMVESAQELCPDVPFAAEGCLMTAWVKKAQPKFDENKRMIPWTA